MYQTNKSGRPGIVGLFEYTTTPELGKAPRFDEVSTGWKRGSYIDGYFRFHLNPVIYNEEPVNPRDILGKGWHADKLIVDSARLWTPCSMSPEELVAIHGALAITSHAS